MVQTLFESLQPELNVSPELAARLRVIEEHDFSGVRRKVQEEAEKRGWTPSGEWLEAGILALKQYYAIAVIDGVNLHAVSDPVDLFWHAHILHTRTYAEFCDRLTGRFLHHEPLDHGNAEDVAFVGRLYAYTLRRYGECFCHVDARFHPAELSTVELVCLHGGDEAAAVYAVFPKIAEAQPDGTSFARH